VLAQPTRHTDSARYRALYIRSDADNTGADLADDQFTLCGEEPWHTSPTAPLGQQDSLIRKVDGVAAELQQLGRLEAANADQRHVDVQRASAKPVPRTCALTNRENQHSNGSGALGRRLQLVLDLADEARQLQPHPHR
jgi:hypothetical protein